MLLPRILGRSHATAAAYVAAKTPFSPVRPFHASAALRAIDMSKVDTTQRLADLRKLMKERNVDIYSRRAHRLTCDEW
jgi:Xaa-Pro aminopeptidase